MASTENLVKSSFFDELNEESELENMKSSNGLNKKSGLWIKLKNFTLNELNERFLYFCNEILFEGKLIKKSKKHRVLKHKYFVLYKDRLEQYEDEKKENDQRKCFMVLSGVKIEVLDNTLDEKSKNTYQKYCLIFTQNKTFFILYALTWDLCETWYQNLKRCCVLNYFAKSFTNLKIIGKGSFARVLLSKRNNDQKEFAVKTFDKKVVATKSKQGLINEISLMRILDHPNIITLYEIYEGDYHIYLVCELLKGGELFERIIKTGHYSEKDACFIIAQLLNALEYAHLKGVMHRDIKPENLILKNEVGFELKLADFGLADFVHRKNPFYKRCGTPGYVAPEILNDEDYDTKVDIFSTGVILYIMLTGTSPFYGKTYNDILIKNRKCEISFDFSFLNYKISDDGCDLLKKMLRKDPKERISANEALKHKWILTYTDFFEETVNPILSSGDSNIRAPHLKECLENMKTSCLKQSKIEASIEYDITMSTPVMTGRTLPLPMTNENQFQSPAFLLTPIVSKMKMGKNEDVSSALQSLKGMVGMTPSAKRDQMLMTPKNVQKGFKGDINEMGFRSELIRGRVLPNNQNMNSFLYQNKIVKPKTTCEQLKKIETDKNEERNGFEENKVFDGEEKNHVAPKKEEERVSNVKSKLKNLEL